MSCLIDSHTISLLHFDNDFKDECGKTWVQEAASNIPANVSPKITSDQSKWGEALYLEGLGSALKCSTMADFDFGPNDFTIDCWIYPLNHGYTTNTIFSNGSGGNANAYLWSKLRLFYWGVGSGLALALEMVGTNNTRMIDGSQVATLLPNNWYHIAIVRNGSNVYLFINGVLTKTFTNIGTLYPLSGSTFSFLIGDSGIGGDFYKGYIDEFRVSNVARWTSNFTPPNTPYCNLNAEAFKDKMNSLHGYK